jgi:hypothetical protein
MVADDMQMSYPYVNAKGNMVDLAFDDEHCIVKVCHYVMLHCAKSTFISNPSKKNNMESTPDTRNLLSMAVQRL